MIKVCYHILLACHPDPLYRSPSKSIRFTTQLMPPNLFFTNTMARNTCATPQTITTFPRPCGARCKETWRNAQEHQETGKILSTLPQIWFSWGNRVAGSLVPQVEVPSRIQRCSITRTLLQVAFLVHDILGGFGQSTKKLFITCGSEKENDGRCHKPT